MADFFALGDVRSETTNNHQEHLQNLNTQSNHIITESWFSLFKNEEIQPYKGLELWQPQLSTTHHHHHHHQQHPQVDDSLGFFMVRQGGSNNSGGGISCQDCGNQAKKDCVHVRCRTCCKSRGFECQTHVKSTWVPASERRKRQLAAASDSSHEQRLQQEEHHQLYKGTRQKRLTDIHSPSLEVGNFLEEVNSKASFRRIRVDSINKNTQEEYAYQAVVKIEGHVFKGILYDQGPSKNQSMAGESSNTCGGASVIGGGGGGGGGGGQLVSLIPCATATTTAADGGCLASETHFLDHTLFSAQK